MGEFIWNAELKIDRELDAETEEKLAAHVATLMEELLSEAVYDDACDHIGDAMLFAEEDDEEYSMLFVIGTNVVFDRVLNTRRFPYEQVIRSVVERVLKPAGYLLRGHVTWGTGDDSYEVSFGVDIFDDNGACESVLVSELLAAAKA